MMLCEVTGEQGTSPLIALLVGSDASLLFSVAVENGCWWIPTVRRGKNCLGTAALSQKSASPDIHEISEESKAGAGQFLQAPDLVKPALPPKQIARAF